MVSRSSVFRTPMAVRNFSLSWKLPWITGRSSNNLTDGKKESPGFRIPNFVGMTACCFRSAAIPDFVCWV